MPFYPTPDRDDGYDITDFYGVDPRLGTLGDFVEVIRTARDRGMRVIVDLVVNHTSDKHPWFRRARRQPHVAVPRLLRLARRAADEARRAVVFPDEETSVWELRRDAPASTTCTASTSTSPTSTSPTRGCATRSPRSIGLLAGARPLRLPGRRRAVPASRPPDAGVDDSATRTSSCATCGAFLQRRVGDAVLLGEVNLPYEQQLRVLRRRATATS